MTQQVTQKQNNLKLIRNNHRGEDYVQYNAFLNTVCTKDTSALRFFFHVNQLEFYKCNDKTPLADSAVFLLFCCFVCF